MKPTYEFTFLVPVHLSQPDREQIEKKIEEMIRAREGEILEKVPLGRKKLAYSIRGEHQGEYFYWLFQSNGGIVKEIDKYLKLTPGVLRYLFVRVK